MKKKTEIITIIGIIILVLVVAYFVPVRREERHTASEPLSQPPFYVIVKYYNIYGIKINEKYTE